MLRPDRREISRLVWALVASLLLHGACYGGYEGGKALHLWEHLHLPGWIQRITKSILPRVKDVAKQPPHRDQPPLMFVQVNPANTVVEPPKNAKYYAAHSTRAANPEADRDTSTPKISGEQDKVMQTEDVAPNAQPLQPAPAPAPPKESQPEASPPKPELRPTELAMAKPEESQAKTHMRPRPRSIAEAKARLAQHQNQNIIGQRVKQEGGVRRRSVSSSLDAIGSPFGAYDAAIVAAIQARWYALLDERSYASDHSGKVVLTFRLNYDGRVTDMKVVEHSVDEVLSFICQRAVLDPAPFARWPNEMRRLAKSDYREVRFTFYYN